MPAHVRGWLQRNFPPAPQAVQQEPPQGHDRPVALDQFGQPLLALLPQPDRPDPFGEERFYRAKAEASGRCLHCEQGSARPETMRKPSRRCSCLELIELRDTLLVLPKPLPNHDDGVQITAPPLWHTHKPGKRS